MEVDSWIQPVQGGPKSHLRFVHIIGGREKGSNARVTELLLGFQTLPREFAMKESLNKEDLGGFVLNSCCCDIECFLRKRRKKD